MKGNNNFLLILLIINIVSVITGIYFETFNILNPKAEFLLFPLLTIGYLIGKADEDIEKVV